MTFHTEIVKKSLQSVAFQQITLSEHRDEVAATAFFKQAIDYNGLPSKVVIDKSGANNVGLENINVLIFLVGLLCFIEILKVKYLNNIVEQDHRFIKKITKPMMGFKAFHSASATLAGIETAHMIRKGQLANSQLPTHQQFMALAV
jgi:putative transposase